MKDLKRYLTKKIYNKNAYDYSLDKLIKAGDLNAPELFAYLVYNSYQKQTNYINKIKKSIEDEDLFLMYSLFEYDNMHIDDILTTDKAPVLCYFRSLVLDALFPDYIVDEYYHYVDDINDEDLTTDENLFEESKAFLQRNHVPGADIKGVLDLFKKDLVDTSNAQIIVVKSRYLRKIYRRKELRDLLEQALCCEFVRPNMILQSSVIYTDCWEGRDGDLMDSERLVDFIKSYNTIYGIKGRQYRYNSEYAFQLLDVANYNYSFYIELINNVFETCDTKEMVMF